ncbi:DUF983 domain-containing protein [Sphingobacteriaceae bacterium WQ 2009]|uniref:DUF983 domain-containing protein n=1 Tax=Rhinopithecimicrobium faecis TaxID=2820698 RepID=A0A8T4H944_9SPHI|nr:DUF983 domain-containing protein [Sphingobacteriaceae bacterium WQ 2009]
MSTSKVSAMLQSKCPKCRVAPMFEGATYSLKGRHMHEFCPHCQLKFEIEPGYFYAAMYVSYAMNVAQTLTLAIATSMVTQSESPWLYIAVLFFTVFIFAPFNFRYSRVILLHLMTPKISYDPRFERSLENIKKDTH